MHSNKLFVLGRGLMNPCKFNIRISHGMVFSKFKGDNSIFERQSETVDVNDKT